MAKFGHKACHFVTVSFPGRVFFMGRERDPGKKTLI